MRNSNFLISTTGNIEGGTIKKYIDTVCANVVVGTNVLSDFAASFTDFFGGHSGTYQRKLELIYDEAKKGISAKARAVGANAVIGLKIDFDQVSGKNMSMLMVSVCGTACVVDYNTEDGSGITDIRHAVPQEDLEREMKKNGIAGKINGGGFPESSMVDFMLENPQLEIVGSLIDRYIESYGGASKYADFAMRYLSLFSDEEIGGIVYGKYNKNKDAVWKIIHECRLFNPPRVLEICRQDVHSGISLLDAWKSSYSKEDLEGMEQLYDYLCNHLPDTARIESVKEGMFGKKEKERFICEKGHKNPADVEFCFTCGRNIKGLTKEDIGKIDILKERIHTLRAIFGKV